MVRQIYNRLEISFVLLFLYLFYLTFLLQYFLVIIYCYYQLLM